MTKPSFRREKDSMGEMQIPADRLWGAQTQRALENFPISGYRFPSAFIAALGTIKQACAIANTGLELLDEEVGNAIVDAAGEVGANRLDDHFPLDIFQTGSGTSTNMNANEVIANRANEMLGSAPGSRYPVHPNDHVNLGQSSNDVIPTAIHITAVQLMTRKLRPALLLLRDSLHLKVDAFRDVVKTGRTHLQDAMPVTMGQVFSGYATQTAKSLDRLESAVEALREVPLGGTAVGTGINRHASLPMAALDVITQITGEDFYVADNAMEASGTRDGLVEASSQLRTIAVSLKKIGEDIRWMSSGPRNGLGELILPEVQPGSSIMPGKINPVIIESLLMVCAQVIGNDQTVMLGGAGSRFELNVMMPVMAHNLLESITLLASSVENFSRRCIEGVRVNADQCRRGLERNLALATALAPEIGYDLAATVSKVAYETDRTVRDVAVELTALSEERLDQILDPGKLTG